MDYYKALLKNRAGELAFVRGITNLKLSGAVIQFNHTDCENLVIEELESEQVAKSVYDRLVNDGAKV